MTSTSEEELMVAKRARTRRQTEGGPAARRTGRSIPDASGDSTRFTAPKATLLPESGWELRVGRGSRNRAALEVHTGDGLIDVAVADGLVAALIRGAVRGRRWSVAWGHLPRGGDVLVEFRSGNSMRRVPAITIAGAFWAAEVPGRFRSVVVTTAADRASFRLRRFRQHGTAGLRPQAS
ncbi:hypothetical protein [Actinoallomurus iriomotensis]|nr:hypothetical protein [Actinoallomurus iriomotensis]